MVQSGFHIQGLRALIESLDALVQRELHQVLQEALEQLGTWLLQLTQQRTPIDTGELYQSFNRGHPLNIWRVNFERDTLELHVGSDADHALPVEEGHWANPQGVAVRWVPGYWSGDRFIYDPASDTGMALKQQWIPGYHMFEIAFEQLDPIAQNYLAAKIQGVFDRAAKRIGTRTK